MRYVLRLVFIVSVPFCSLNRTVKDPLMDGLKLRHSITLKFDMLKTSFTLVYILDHVEFLYNFDFGKITI